MRFSIYAILSILLVLVLTNVAVTFKDWSRYKEYITQKLEKEYDAKIHIMGKIEASFIMPKLTIRNVYIQYNGHEEQKLSDLVSVGQVEIRPSFLSLFLFSLQPKSITLLDMKSNRQNLFNIVNKKSSNNIMNILIKDSHISVEDDYINIKEIKIKKNKKFSGKVKINDSHYDFLGKINITKKSIDVNVESKLINLLFQGSKEQEKVNGNLVLTVNNNSDSISDLVKVINLGLLSHLIPSENIKISSNINMDDAEFMMTDLKVESNSMQAHGAIHNDRKSNHTNVSVKFSKIDLDFIQDNSRKKVDVKDLLECFKRSIPEDLSLDFNIDASNINYQKKILDNFRAAVKFVDSKATVNTLLKLPGINNIFYLSGEVSSNNVLSEFNGNLQVEGNDFESFISCFFPSITINEDKKNQFILHSKVHFAPRVLSISDITLLNHEEFLQGSIKVSYTKKHNMIDGRFSIHNLNADKYNFGSLYKVQWLKKFNHDVNIKISINDLILNDKKIKSLDFLLNIEKNRLVANRIQVHGEGFDTTGNVRILMDQGHVKPLVDIDFIGKKFNGNIIKLPDFIEKTKTSKNKITQVQWSTKRFDFLNNIENFDANVRINTEAFTIRQSNLKDFHLDALIRNNTITVRQVNYALEEGKVSFQGYMRSDSMYTRFFISELEVSKMSKAVGINNARGQVSLSGTVKTHGKSLYDWANNYLGEVKLGAQKVTFSNIDLNSFITNLLGSKNKSEVVTFANVDIYKGSTSFRNLKGKASISNGICSTGLQFQIDRASGAISANLNLSNFNVDSILRLFFIPPNQSNSVYIDMHLDGPIWNPKVSFEIDKIFATFIKDNT